MEFRVKDIAMILHTGLFVEKWLARRAMPMAFM
jgi:hypothetical protein